MPDNADTTPETQSADEADAEATHKADRMPTPEEERLAESQELDPEVAESYKEAAERGANVKGEGEI
ncbi:hypothetical protein [Rhabdothermincola salaria]|uniref:hypothetical protein n=1 Tax=Rhabdothermincola salaria TaxID=2903142 RepID=UPI001E2E2CFE|nr:hypothetical protein [Rhabdothermincola salaria]MCD9622711.1 hypothetical protein [Rhabdothermincola salaria]